LKSALGGRVIFFAALIAILYRLLFSASAALLEHNQRTFIRTDS
jgi:hypothetical protein